MPLTRIPDGGVLDFNPIPTGFTQDVADVLGQFGTPNDGMEDLFNQMALSIDGDAKGLADTISILDEITDVDYDSFQANTFDPITTDLGNFTTAGQTLVDTFSNDLTVPNPPPPPPPQPPAPNGGGGGGGGGGNGGGGGGECGWAIDPNTEGWVWTCIL